MPISDSPIAVAFTSMRQNREEFKKKMELELFFMKNNQGYPSLSPRVMEEELKQ